MLVKPHSSLPFGPRLVKMHWSIFLKGSDILLFYTVSSLFMNHKFCFEHFANIYILLLSLHERRSTNLTVLRDVVLKYTNESGKSYFVQQRKFKWVVSYVFQF